MRTFLYYLTEVVLILLILLTVGHAFYQSSLPPAESTAQSSKVGEIIEEIIPPDTPPGEYIQKNLRKLAHFTEFFFLGLWSTLLVGIYIRCRWAISALVPFGLIVALLDETVQIFSKRGPSVTDVWIDMLGYSVALAITVFVLAIVYFVKFILDSRYI